MAHGVDVQAQALQVDAAFLEDIVCQVLEKPKVKIIDWDCKPIHGGFELRNTVVRCQGQAKVGNQILPWSIVVKKISEVAENIEPTGIWYWKREAEAYQSGFFERMPGYLTAPRCYAVVEQNDASMYIWMEDVQDDLGRNWPMEHYDSVAYQLGRFNAAYLTGTPLPTEKWITRNWLRQYVEHAAPMINFMRDNPEHPLVQSMYGSNLALILSIWDTRHQLLDILDRMPQVFCHQDAFKLNLFTRKNQLVAIDWGYAGIAPVGTEMVSLIAVSLGLGKQPPHALVDLDRICFNGYMRGLRHAGVNIPTKSVRRCYAITLLLRYIVGANIGEIMPALLDESMHERVTEALHQTVEETSIVQKDIEQYYLAETIEALKLMGIEPLVKFLAHVVSNTLRLMRTHK